MLNVSAMAVPIVSVTMSAAPTKDTKALLPLTHQKTVTCTMNPSVMSELLTTDLRLCSALVLHQSVYPKLLPFLLHLFSYLQQY